MVTGKTACHTNQSMPLQCQCLFIMYSKGKYYCLNVSNYYTFDNVIQLGTSLEPKPGVIKRKHILYPTYYVAYFPARFYWMITCAGATGKLLFSPFPFSSYAHLKVITYVWYIINCMVIITNNHRDWIGRMPQWQSSNSDLYRKSIHKNP